MGTKHVSAGAMKIKSMQWAAVLVLAVGTGLLVVGFFRIQVCDQQLSDSGAVVSICRHPQLTDPPVVAVGIMMLAALAAFFTEISGFGITLKRTVEAANRAAEAAERTANTAKATVEEVAGDLAEGIGAALRSRVGAGDDEVRSDTIDPVVRLAARYNEIRWTIPSGGQRTAQMTRVMLELQELLRGVQNFDVTGYLHSEDRGLRLAGIAYLNSNGCGSAGGKIVFR